jgi:hypothetical protein
MAPSVIPGLVTTESPFPFEKSVFDLDQQQKITPNGAEDQYR